MSASFNQSRYVQLRATVIPTLIKFMLSSESIGVSHRNPCREGFLVISGSLDRFTVLSAERSGDVSEYLYFLTGGQISGSVRAIERDRPHRTDLEAERDFDPPSSCLTVVFDDKRHSHALTLLIRKGQLVDCDVGLKLRRGRGPKEVEALCSEPQGRNKARSTSNPKSDLNPRQGNHGSSAFGHGNLGFEILAFNSGRFRLSRQLQPFETFNQSLVAGLGCRSIRRSTEQRRDSYDQNRVFSHHVLTIADQPAVVQ